MGALPPTPQDLSQFPSRVDGWFVVAIGGCRTRKRLDRRIGLRRDATRAPTQARSGWAAFGPPPGQPAAGFSRGRAGPVGLGLWSPQKSEKNSWSPVLG